MKLKFLFPVALLLLVGVRAFGQTSERSYYVTIGVYGIQHYAEKFAEAANAKNLNAQIAKSQRRKLHYVYIFSSPDKATAIAYMLKTRLETDYKDAWVFGGILGESVGGVKVVEPVADKPEVKPEPQPVVKTEEKPPVKEEPKEVPVVQPKEEPVTAPPVETKPTVTEPVVTPPVEKPVEAPAEPPHPAGTVPFLFKLMNQDNGAQIIGEVHVQEALKATQYQAFRGNEVVYLHAPANAAGTYTVVTNAPGYQQIKYTINFKEPGLTKGDRNAYVVPLDLKRAKHGDYIDFNNVKFVRNSSIMTPDSQTELDGLAMLMKDNLKYKIKIHGHCNGKVDRECIVLGTSTNFFSMDPKGNKKEVISAMKLSDERALAVKKYIVLQGIDGSRIVTKGEGGKIPLYPATSTLNAYNDRVEIEVKKD